MRRFAGYFMGIGLACAPAPHARAQPGATLDVERAEGAESCPDAAALAARVESIRGAVASGSTHYTVTFEHEAEVYSTQIRGGPDGAEVRRIEDRGVDCAALAQATALTLALLYDADAARASTPAPAPVTEPAPAATAPAATAPAPVAVDDTDRAAPRWRPSLSLGGGVLIGVLRPVAPALLADGGIVGDRLRFMLGALFVPSQRLELAPGHVNTWLLSGSARACYAPLRSGSIRFDVCTGFTLGAIKGSADGFTHTESHTRLFTALPVEVAFAQLARTFGWELGAALLVPFRRNQFAVDNAGTAYDSPPIAVLVTLRGVALWPW